MKKKKTRKSDQPGKHRESSSEITTTRLDCHGNRGIGNTTIFFLNLKSYTKSHVSINISLQERFC